MPLNSINGASSGTRDLALFDFALSFSEFEIKATELTFELEFCKLVSNALMLLIFVLEFFRLAILLWNCNAVLALLELAALG
jgi:hypothetical protein